MPAQRATKITIDSYTVKDSPNHFARFKHADLPDEFLTMLFFEHNEIPPDGRTLDEFREFFNRVGRHTLNPDGTLSIAHDVWTVTLTPGDEEVDLSLHVRNETDTDWHDLVSITACVSPKGWGYWKILGTTPDQAPPVSPTFADRETRNKTFISTKDGPFLLADRSKHFFDEETLSRILSLPYRTNVFRVGQHKAAPPFTDRGLIARHNKEKGWVLGYGWEDCLCVNANNPLDCLHPTTRIGPVVAGGERTIRGKIYLFQGTLDDLFARYDKDLGGSRQ